MSLVACRSRTALRPFKPPSNVHYRISNSHAGYFEVDQEDQEEDDRQVGFGGLC